MRLANQFIYSLLALMLICLPHVCMAQGKGTERSKMTFTQLIATRYPTGATVPAEGAPPALPTYDFVDKTKLPTGAKLTSAARLGRETTWVLTDKGAFQWQGDKFVPLDLPRSFKPFQPQVHGDTKLIEVTSD